MRFLIPLLIVCLVAPVAWGATMPEAVPAQLTAHDRADIERIEIYLNNLKSVSADFVQVNDNGEFRHGKIAIQRPGKMRVTYDPPQKDFIVADGTYVHIWDGELKQQTNVLVGSSIAEFILRDPIKLSGDVIITRFVRFPSKMELSIVATNDPGDGELTLIFEDNPLQLRQWRVLDAQGRTTGVNLENEREDVTFASNTFDFVPPNFGKSERGNK